MSRTIVAIMATRRASGSSWATALVLTGLVVSCSGASNSEVSASGGTTSDAYGSTTGGVTASGTGTGAPTTGNATGGVPTTSNASSGGAPTTSNASSSGSSNATGGTAGASLGTDGCPALATWTEAVRFVLKASWDANAAGLAGTADIEVMSLVKLTADGNTLAGPTRGCRTVMPANQLSGAGQIVTGGTKILTDIPDSVWDAPSMANHTAPCTGTQSGMGVSSTVQYGWTSLIGTTLSEPNGAWPASGAGMAIVDVDGDSKPGFTCTPKSGDGFVLPPTGLGILGSAPTSDKVYLVNRNIISLSGTRTSCDKHAGTATFSAFDSHVVGCHTKSGDCTASQVDFSDQMRPMYKINSATYEARRVPDTATCQDVRDAFSS